MSWLSKKIDDLDELLSRGDITQRNYNEQLAELNESDTCNREDAIDEVVYQQNRARDANSGW